MTFRRMARIGLAVPCLPAFFPAAADAGLTDARKRGNWRRGSSGRAGRFPGRNRWGVIGPVRKLETGVTPPLTYNANRRSGAVGAAMLRMDGETGRLVPASEWRESE